MLAPEADGGVAGLTPVGYGSVGERPVGFGSKRSVLGVGALDMDNDAATPEKEKLGESDVAVLPDLWTKPAPL